MGRGWVNAVREAAGAKKGKLFTKIAKEIAVAVRLGGANAEANARLKSALRDAQKNSMPKDTIDRAIKRGSGPADGEQLEEVTYEAYGPHGVALIVEAFTDNRNRTVQDLRALLARNSGTLAEANAVAWMFERCGALTAKGPSSAFDAEELAIEAGASDLQDEGDQIWTFFAAPSDLEPVVQYFTDRHWEVLESGLVYRPKNRVSLSEEQEKDLAKLLEALQDNDDVKKIHASA